jgi:hypothetical protein
VGIRKNLGVRKKLKIKEGEGIGACSLVHSTLGVKGMLELRDGTKKINKQFNYSHRPAQTKLVNV